MSDRSSSSPSREGSSTNQSAGDTSTDFTTTYASEHSDTQTIATTTESASPPSNPETPSAPSEVSDMQTVTDGGDSELPAVQVNGVSEPNYGLEVIHSRDEPWSPRSPRITPQPSQQELRTQPGRDQEDRNGGGSNENDDNAGNSSGG